LKAIYLPYWTFDAAAHADWTAMSGDYYYTTETYRDSNGRMQTRQVRHVRWYPTSGSLDHFFDDDLVPGTVGARIDLLRKIEPFPTRELRPYDPAFVRGWIVERYQVDLRKASQLNRARMDQEMQSLCASRVPGDTHRDLQVRTAYRQRTFKHILVPVWLVHYTFGPKSFQVLVNGYTGNIAGDRPFSALKLFFYVILPSIILVAVFLWIASQQN
ncbi:MAG TPA: zinc ribbon domain-containing protein, partial [Terriglobia bacterium]|nr:zinc ribbon domain-containing protein [Terriglobia bacterium]